MAYTTGAEVKADITTALTPSEIEATIIPEAEAVINAYVCRNFNVNLATEVIDGAYDIEILLSRYPLIAVSSIVVGEVTLNSTDDYITRGNVITLRHGSLRPGRANVVITYTYGFATVPLPVQRACRLLAQNYIIESQRENYEKGVDDDMAELSYYGYAKSNTLAVLKDSTGDDAVDRLLQPYRLP